MEKVKLKDICLMQSGGTPSRSKSEFYSGNIPWAKISDLEKSKDGNIYETEEHITEEALKSINNRFFKVGTLLLAMYGSVGKTAIAKIDLSTNQAILGINIIDNKKVDIKYLKYWFTTIKEQLLNRAVGAALANISLGIVKELEIPLPPLTTQQKIAAILDQATAIIANNRAIVEKYDALTQSLFLDMFGDPVKNEKGWEKDNCRNILKVIGGGVFKSSDYVKNGIPLIRIGSVNKGYFDDRETVFIPETYIKTHKKYLVYPNDLLITLTGTVGKNDYGNVFKLGNDYEKYYLNQRVAKFEINKTKIDSVFFEFYLKQNEIKKLLTIVSRGVRQANISNEDIYNLEIILPSIHLQNQFAERVSAIAAQKQQAQLELAKSEELFNSLLQRAFKGTL